MERDLIISTGNKTWVYGGRQVGTKAYVNLHYRRSEGVEHPHGTAMLLMIFCTWFINFMNSMFCDMTKVQ